MWHIPELNSSRMFNKIRYTLLALNYFLSTIVSVINIQKDNLKQVMFHVMIHQMLRWKFGQHVMSLQSSLLDAYQRKFFTFYLKENSKQEANIFISTLLCFADDATTNINFWWNMFESCLMEPFWYDMLKSNIA